jgi:predicted kinase
MSGLPASGKTTTAQRLHAKLGGVLIRQCDIYERLGIDLRAWVLRTERFTRETAAYEAARDHAYVAMHEELAAALEGARPVIVDAVYGEPAKRRAAYAVCDARGRSPIVVWCRCDDPDEVRRRILARVGCDGPEHEASDLSVYTHLQSLWTPPGDERLADGTPVPVIVHDTTTDGWSGLGAVPALARAVGRL